MKEGRAGGDPLGMLPFPGPRGKWRDWGPAKQFGSSELEVNHLGTRVCCTCKRDVFSGSEQLVTIISAGL